LLLSVALLCLISVFSTDGTASITSLFFFSHTVTTAIYTLSLHDALPISMDRVKLLPLEFWCGAHQVMYFRCPASETPKVHHLVRSEEHTSNSSHGSISYAVFCLKKKKKRKPKLESLVRC